MPEHDILANWPSAGGRGGNGCREGGASVDRSQTPPLYSPPPPPPPIHTAQEDSAGSGGGPPWGSFWDLVTPGRPRAAAGEDDGCTLLAPRFAAAEGLFPDAAAALALLGVAMAASCIIRQNQDGIRQDQDGIRQDLVTLEVPAPDAAPGQAAVVHLDVTALQNGAAGDPRWSADAGAALLLVAGQAAAALALLQQAGAGCDTRCVDAFHVALSLPTQVPHGATAAVLVRQLDAAAASEGKGARRRFQHWAVAAAIGGHGSLTRLALMQAVDRLVAETQHCAADSAWWRETGPAAGDARDLGLAARLDATADTVRREQQLHARAVACARGCGMSTHPGRPPLPKPESPRLPPFVHTQARSYTFVCIHVLTESRSRWLSLTLLLGGGGGGTAGVGLPRPPWLHRRRVSAWCGVHPLTSAHAGCRIQQRHGSSRSRPGGLCPVAPGATRCLRVVPVCADPAAAAAAGRGRGPTTGGYRPLGTCTARLRRRIPRQW